MWQLYEVLIEINYLKNAQVIKAAIDKLKKNESATFNSLQFKLRMI